MYSKNVCKSFFKEYLTTNKTIDAHRGSGEIKYNIAPSPHKIFNNLINIDAIKPKIGDPLAILSGKP
jgi:hypothetical protein